MNATSSQASLQKSPGDNNIRVLIVDDHYFLRQGLRAILDEQEDMRVTGEAEGGEAALALLREVSADVVLLDVKMPGIDGIETLVRLKKARPDVKVLMLTSYGDEFLMSAIQAGAEGYLLKWADQADLVKAIRETSEGGSPLDPKVTPGVLEHLRSSTAHTANQLSPRETQILELVAAGLSNKEIAADLGVTPPTVKNHVTSILRKLDVSSRTHAVTVGLRMGWIVNPTLGQGSRAQASEG